MNDKCGRCAGHGTITGVDLDTGDGYKRPCPQCDPYDRALAALDELNIEGRYPTADYSGTSRRRADRAAEHAARRAHQEGT